MVVTVGGKNRLWAAKRDFHAAAARAVHSFYGLEHNVTFDSG